MNDTLNTEPRIEPRELTDLELDAVAGGDLTKLGKEIVAVIQEAITPLACGWLVCNK